MTKLKWWEIENNDQAKTMIGSIVYEAYTPSRVGKVIDCWLEHPYGRGHAMPVAKVKWLRQTKKYPDPVSEVLLHALNDFEALIEDHRRKYKKHKKVLDEVKTL